jgi:NitT/TauT family transport system permease protein
MNSPITSAVVSSLVPQPERVARAQRLRAAAERASPLLLCIAIVLAWETACRVLEIPTFLLPAPTAILAGATEQAPSTWAKHIGATIRVALIGYFVAIAISIPLAIILASSKLLARTLYPIIVVVQATPIVAVAPIIVVVLGTSDLPRVTITFLITFFPIVVSTTTGLLATPPEMIELSRSLRAGRAREVFQIRLPFAVPYIFSSLKISITLAFVGAVVAEFVAAEQGLGYFIQFATSFFKIAQAFAALIVLVTISLLAFQVVVLMQTLLAPWSLPKTEH